MLRLPEDREAQRRQDGVLVRAALAGDELAFGRLFDRWIDRVVAVAAQVVRDQGLAADVAQEVLIRAWRKLDQLRDPEGFGPWVLRSARNAAISQVRRDARTQAVGDMNDVEHTEGSIEELASIEDPAELVHRQELIALVWNAAEALDLRDRSLLDLHLRHGLTPGELAAELNVTPNNAHQIMFRLRKRFSGAFTALILWNDGAPRCRELRALLEEAGAVEFDAATASLINAHADDCDVCRNRRTSTVAPVALFSALPVVAVPLAMKHDIVRRLHAAGVPMAGSVDQPGHVPRVSSRAATRRGAIVTIAAASVVVGAFLWSSSDGQPGHAAHNVAAADPSIPWDAPQLLPKPTPGPAGGRAAASAGAGPAALPGPSSSAGPGSPGRAGLAPRSRLAPPAIPVLVGFGGVVVGPSPTGVFSPGPTSTTMSTTSTTEPSTTTTEPSTTTTEPSTTTSTTTTEPSTTTSTTEPTTTTTTSTTSTTTTSTTLPPPPNG